MADSACACGGLGVVRRDAAPGHPDFGKLFPCPGREHVSERIEQLYSLSGLKPHERYSLDSIENMNGATAHLVKAVGQFIADPRGWLYLWGSYGNGKSLALMAGVRAFVETGQPALYITLADLLDVMRETFKQPSLGAAATDEQWRRWSTYQARFERIRSVKLLAVDEFDATKINETGFVREFRARLIDHRYRDALAGTTCTLFAGNDNPASLPGWIYDRVRDNRFRIFHNTGQSVRPVMEW